MNNCLQLIILSSAISVIAQVSAASPSAALVPIKGDIIFSHELHVIGNAIECAICHASIDSSRQAIDYNLPSMDVCSSCHDQVSQDTACGMCHRNTAEPQALPRVSRPIVFSHATHVSHKVSCTTCHTSVERSREPSAGNYPIMADCMACHNGTRAPDKCALCHENRITLADIHPPNWKVQHGDAANGKSDWCQGCHRNQESCIACHRGDNIQGKIHDLNFPLTHGLQAKTSLTNCLTCHDSRTFCNDCHVSQLRMPLEHSLANWRSRHGEAAREDVENCQACHDSDDPTCARSGCHRDSDGIRGTNPGIHGGRSGQLNGHGPWHDDDNYFCFQCHTNTRVAGQGFCGYCHGGGD